MKIEITEIFTAKAGNDWSRCFHGTIRRESDNNNPIVYGKIKINDGYIYAKAKDQWELGEKLDTLVLMVLDKNIHSDSGKTSEIANIPYFFN